MKTHIRENLPAALCIVAAATAATALPSIGDHLALRPDGDAVTIAWQLFTCHLVHCTPEHLFFDALCLLLLSALLTRRELATTLLLAAPAVSLTVLLLHPELPSYCGLSGVNCALYSLFAANLSRTHRTLGTAALAGVLLKTLIEINADRTFFATSGFIPVHAAHLAGIAVGAAIGIRDSIVFQRHCKTFQTV